MSNPSSCEVAEVCLVNRFLFRLQCHACTSSIIVGVESQLADVYAIDIQPKEFKLINSTCQCHVTHKAHRLHTLLSSSS